MVEYDTWHNCYKLNWYQRCHPDGIYHPAKVSYLLAKKIYDHLNLGPNKSSINILDPFAGVSCFALHAMQRGYNWYGIELEPSFVELSQKNIDYWNNRYNNSHNKLPNWGSATIIHGNSENIDINNLYHLIPPSIQFDAIITSPPYEGMMKREMKKETYIRDTIHTRSKRIKQNNHRNHWDTPGRFKSILAVYAGYSDSKNNLGNKQNTDFWDTLSNIIRNISQYLKPNSYWIWVTKDMVKDKVRLDIASRLIDVSSQHNLHLEHHHKAMLVEDYGEQAYMRYIDNEEEEEINKDMIEFKPIQIKRGSFFRYMHDKHYPENRIDWEDVLCMRKTE